MALEGSLQVFNLPEILQMIALQHKTGILTVQGQQEIIAISFLAGQVVAADALNQTVEEGLGQVLAGQGLVRPEDFAAAAAEHQTGGGRLVDLLVARGYLGRPQLLAALRDQTFGLLLQVLRWREGDFKFYSGDEVSFEEGFRPISVEELLLRSLGEEGEAEPELAVPSPAHVYSRLPAARPVKVLDDTAAWGLPRGDAEIWLTAEEMALLEHLDGRRTAAALAGETGLGEAKVLHALYRLQQVGLAAPLLSRPGARPAAPAPSTEAEPSPRAAAPPRAVPGPRAAPRAPAALSAVEVGEGVPEAAARPFRLASWTGAALALALAAVVLAALVLRPATLLLPFPWQAPERAALERSRREALYQRLERAANTFFLLEGRYPESLTLLLELRLLPAADLVDPQGRPLAYASTDVSYTARPLAVAGARGDLGTSAAISGNFLLDPEYLKLGPQSSVPPLVLLD